MDNALALKSFRGRTTSLKEIEIYIWLNWALGETKPLKLNSRVSDLQQ